MDRRASQPGDPLRSFCGGTICINKYCPNNSKTPAGSFSLNSLCQFLPVYTCFPSSQLCSVPPSQILHYTFCPPATGQGTAPSAAQHHKLPCLGPLPFPWTSVQAGSVALDLFGPWCQGDVGLSCWPEAHPEGHRAHLCPGEEAEGGGERIKRMKGAATNNHFSEDPQVGSLHF